MSSVTNSPIWHPFTQHGLQPASLGVASAEGAWLTLCDGRRVFDAISSWWVTSHGHCHPKIVAAIKQQAETLDQVIFAGMTHEPAEAVARGLVEIAPRGLGRVFFSDSGSTSVEVAIKMALGYWKNIGEPRTRIVALQHGYHGDTVGTMSVGERCVFNAAYEPLLFDVVRLPFPESGSEQETIDALELACREGSVAALLVEPLILGAGGMRLYDAHVLREMKRVCNAFDVVFIADEVMTGWGRTGTMFACEQADVAPDIMCLAKGITGGALPLAATLCSERIFDAHLSDDRTKTLFHSSSYTANPIACAAAAANIEIWKTEPVFERIQALGAVQARNLAGMVENANVTNPRQLGTITAFDIKADDVGYLAQIGLKLYDKFLESRVLLRPLGNTIYVMPPYCATDSELAAVYETVVRSLHELN